MNTTVDKKTTLKTVNIYLRKDGRTLDMRFKENRDFVKANEWSRFNKMMQWLANKLGSPKVFTVNHLYWKHYLNPIWHIKQRRMLKNPIQIYENK